MEEKVDQVESYTKINEIIIPPMTNSIKYKWRKKRGYNIYQLSEIDPNKKKKFTYMKMKGNNKYYE